MINKSNIKMRMVAPFYVLLFMGIYSCGFKEILGHKGSEAPRSQDGDLTPTPPPQLVFSGNVDMEDIGFVASLGQFSSDFPALIFADSKKSLIDVGRGNKPSMSELTEYANKIDFSTHFVLIMHYDLPSPAHLWELDSMVLDANEIEISTTESRLPDLFSPQVIVPTFKIISIRRTEDFESPIWWVLNIKKEGETPTLLGTGEFPRDPRRKDLEMLGYKISRNIDKTFNKCTDSSQCAVVQVGKNACGTPRAFVFAYSTTELEVTSCITDEKIVQKLSPAKQAENQVNCDILDYQNLDAKVNSKSTGTCNYDLGLKYGVQCNTELKVCYRPLPD